MELVLKIAWRNILRHKGKSLVIGVILFLGAYLMTIGNGIISGMDIGIKDNIINSFMGHMVIISDKQKSDNVLFELYGKDVAAIYNFAQIKRILQKESAIKDFLPVGKNMAKILNEDSDMMDSFLLGVDFAAYQKMFPDNLTVIEGSFPKTGESGVLVSEVTRKETYDYTNVWLVPEGSSLVADNLTPEAKADKKNLVIKNQQVFMGFKDDNSTADIRLGVKGIIKYKALNNFWGHFTIMDIESYRKCLGYFSAYEKNSKVSEKSQTLLATDNDNLDKMFGEDMVVIADTKSQEVTKLIIAPEVNQEPVDIDAGAYNLVFIKLQNDEGLEKKTASLEKKLKENNLGVRVVTWKKASGIVGSLAIIIKGVLFSFVVFLFLVAIIIIVNTLSMTALERVSEIGMMRAVGAQKSFICNMFIAETGILSSIFGGLGVILGAITVFILPLLNITTKNDMVQLLYGGDVLRPVLNTGDILITIGQLVLVTLVAVIYPMHIAKNIKPLDAIARD